MKQAERIAELDRQISASVADKAKAAADWAHAGANLRKASSDWTRAFEAGAKAVADRARALENWDSSLDDDTSESNAEPMEVPDAHEYKP